MGGGAIRAVAKAGLGAFSGSHNPVASAVRQATRSTVAVVSSVKLEEAKMVAGKIESPVSPIGLQTPWDLEDLEMANGDNLFMEPIEPLPRVVFDAAPTIEEAKDACSELTTVIEKAYLSPNAPGLAGSWVSSHKPDLALPSSSEYVETKTCVGNEASISPAAPKHAIQAFRLLHESTAAQTVVASIASDRNVWNAVMQNEELVKYLEAKRIGVAYPEMNQSVTVEELADDDESHNPQSPMSSEKSRDSKESGPGKWFMHYVGDIKERITTSIIEMMNTLSDTIQNLFGGAVKGDSSAHSDGIPEATIATSIMTVVVMVIMVVVLKRA